MGILGGFKFVPYQGGGHFSLGCLEGYILECGPGRLHGIPEANWLVKGYLYRVEEKVPFVGGLY